jgi:SAM-dependent methyltransferase
VAAALPVWGSVERSIREASSVPSSRRDGCGTRAGRYAWRVEAAPARYDGHAEWYDDQFTINDEDREALARVLELGGDRLCLDVACGAGRYTAGLTDLGYQVVGIDLSRDQLRIAKQRSCRLVRANAAVMPLRSASIDVAVGMYFHTDVEDFAGVVTEIGRCLKVGGRFVYIGLHPCFIGPFVDRSRERDDSGLHFVAGYGASTWAYRGSGGGVGLWSRVGGHHKALAGFLCAFPDAGLRLDRLAELPGGGTVLPRNIAVVTTKY